MARYLITGGCGFIGSHLVDALVAQGDSVIILDNLSTGTRKYVPSEAELVVGDICDAETVKQTMAKVDACFHLAAVSSVTLSNQDWSGTHKVNLSGTINIFDAAWRVRKKPIPVIYASSAAVYGNPLSSEPLSENSPTRPLTAYGADKLGCELHAVVAGNIHKVPTCGLRFFNVYGQRQDPRSPYSGVISIFANRVLSGEKITIFGDGEQTRDFIYVDDVLRYLIVALSHASCASPVFNVCTGKGTSINQLAQTAIKVSSKPGSIEHASVREGDIVYSVGNPEKANKLFDMNPQIDINKGLRKLFNSLNSQ